MTFVDGLAEGETTIWNPSCRRDSHLNTNQEIRGYRGAAAALEVVLNAVRKEHPADCHLSTTMESQLIEFVRESEWQLAEGDRTRLSDGSTSHLQSHGPKTMIVNHLEGVASRQRVITGFGGSSPG